MSEERRSSFFLFVFFNHIHPKHRCARNSIKDQGEMEMMFVRYKVMCVTEMSCFFVVVFFFFFLVPTVRWDKSWNPTQLNQNTSHLRSHILCTEVYRAQNDHLWHPRSEACSRLLARRMPGEREWESWTVTLLPYDRCVALADGDVVGGPLHIHTPDWESCWDKTQQSEKGSLQLPPTRFASDLHVFLLVLFSKHRGALFRQL